MNLLNRLRNRLFRNGTDSQGPTGEEPASDLERFAANNDEDRNPPTRKTNLLRRISPRRLLGKNQEQPAEPPDPNDPTAHTLIGDDGDELDAGPRQPAASTLEDLLASERQGDSTASTSALMTEEGYLDEAGDDARRLEAAPVRFDTRATTLFEPVFRWTLIAALICLVVVAVYLANMARLQFTGASDGSSRDAGALAETADVSATSTSGRAATLAEDFARSYLDYPAEGQQNSEEYLASLQPYLHPDADADLFTTSAGEQRAQAEVSYASARSVQPTPGEDRYKVLVDSRIGTPDSDAGGGEQGQPALSRTLIVYVQVPPQGGEAYVIAPPRLTEPPSDKGAGTPGIYGYEGARMVENESGLKSTLEDFFDALYAPVDSRPLVEEEMEPGAEVDSFPPESHTYEGIERSAIYYRDDLEQAEEQGYTAIYDIEVYVRVSDEQTRSTSLDSWAMTVGETEEEGYKIIDIS